MNPPPRIEPSEEEFRLEEHDPGVKYSNLFIIAIYANNISITVHDSLYYLKRRNIQVNLLHTND